MARMVAPPGRSRTTAGAVGSADSEIDMMCRPLPLRILGWSAQYYGRGDPDMSSRMAAGVQPLGLRRAADRGLRPVVVGANDRPYPTEGFTARRRDSRLFVIYM